MLGFRTAGFIKSNRPTVTLVSSRNDSPKMTGAVPVLHFRTEIRTRSSLLKNKAVLSLAGSDPNLKSLYVQAEFVHSKYITWTPWGGLLNILHSIY